MDKLGFLQGESGGTGDEKMSDLKLQEELAGDDVLVRSFHHIDS